jgi:hypothetical protein
VRSAILLCLAGAGLSLAACGGSSSPGAGGSTSPSDAAASNSKALQFSQCMRAHGVSNFPDAPTGSGGQFDLRIQQTPNSTSVNGVEVNGPAFRSAMNSCRSYLPNGGHPTAAQTAKAKTQALAMARCMRSHGVPNFPDPQFGQNGGIGVKINAAGIDFNSPAFQNAQKECGSILGGAPTVQKSGG